MVATKKKTTGIEWAAALLPEGISDDSLNHLRGLLGEGAVEPDLTRPGRWIVGGFTFNPWRGCTKWAAGCDECYAKAWEVDRWGNDIWGRGKPRIRTSESYWRQPLRWNEWSKQLYAQYGIRLKVFCGSLCDWADSEVSHQWQSDLYGLINQCPDLDWLLLTKRLEVKPWEKYSSGFERMDMILPYGWMDRWPEHVWFGHSVATQRDWDLIQGDLCALVAKAKPKVFISYGPALGSVDWGPPSGLQPIDWMLVEGESGTDARPFHWAWALETLEWCRDNGVRFLMKQVGNNAVAERGDEPISVSKKGGDPREWPAILPRDYI
jgi:protein gp37